MLINNENDLHRFKEGDTISYYCKNCGILYTINSFRKRNINNYKEFLCNKCLRIKRYGCISPFQQKEVQDKIKAINIEKYGSEYPLQSKEIHDKINETNLKRYGNKSSLHDNGEIEERVKKIFNEKYRVNRPLQSKMIYNKTVESNKNNHNGLFHTQTEEWKDKVMKTFIDHYGVDNPMKSSKIIQKSKETCLNNYGEDNPMKVDSVKEKVIDTFITKYGTDNPMKLEETKQKVIDSFKKRIGVNNSETANSIFQLQEFREYMKQDRLNNPDKYASKKIVYYGLSFDSIPEFVVYKFCLDFFIPIIRNDSIYFEYLDSKGKIHYAYPDFIINGTYVEIKGSMFYKPDGTWFKPWRYPEWSDEDYKFQCDNIERKRQCLIKNNVLILRDDDPFITQCTNYILESYGLNYIDSFSKSNPLNNSYGYSPFDKPDADGYFCFK